MERKKTYIYFIIAAVTFCIVFSANIYSSIKSYKYRGLCNRYREQLYTTEEANRKLADRIERIAEITGSIRELSDRNIQSSRDIIETVEQIRAKVYELENCIGGFSQFEYYEYWDNEFGISQ